MPIAANDQGDVVFLAEDGQWKPAQVAESPKGERMAFDGKDWKPLPSPGASAAAGSSAAATPAKSGGMHDEVMQMLKGIPIAGAYAEKTAAGLQAALHPLTGEGDAGDTVGERYSKNLTRESGASAKYEAEHPWLSTGLNVAGGAAATAPMMALRPLAWALGGMGPMAARIPLGAVSGGGIGVADALARGNDPTIAGGVSTAVGAVSPVIGKAVGAVGSRVAQALTKTPEELKPLTGGARNALVDTHTPDTAARLAELGPEGMLFEGNPASFQLAQGVVAREPGAAQSKIVSAVTDRDKGANARIRTDVESNLGPYQEPEALKQRIEEQMQQTAKQYAGVAGAGQQRLDAAPILAKLDEQIASAAGPKKEALQKARGYFFGPERNIDPNTGAVSYSGSKLKTEVYDLHQVRQALDDLHDMLAATPKAQGAIVGLRKDLDNIMPAPMKAVDRQMEDLYLQKKALETGQSKILRTGPEATTPKGLQDFEASGGHAAGPISPGQADMLKAGTRADVERMVGTNANDVAALRKAVGGEGDWNRAKLAQLFGQAEADRVINAVDREVAFKEAVTKLRDNAQTAMRQGAAKYVDKTVLPEGDIKPIPGLHERILQMPEWLLRKGVLEPAKNELNGIARVRGDEGLADVLTKMGPERDRIVSALADYANRRSQNSAAVSVPADRIAQLLALAGGLEIPRAAQH